MSLLRRVLVDLMIIQYRLDNNIRGGTDFVLEKWSLRRSNILRYIGRYTRLLSVL
jgi:hypothetical protein